MMREDIKVILASKSPRRSELLSRAGIKFECMVSEKEEKITSSVPSDVVKSLSLQKAEEVFLKAACLPEENILIIGADTVVEKDGVILGKPENREDAYRMLTLLSGSVHSVYTGVTLIYQADGKKKIKTFAEETKVYMYPISEEEKWEYIATGECDDKAGSYAIQGLAGRFIKKIEGDYNNVVGLPVASVYQKIKELEKIKAAEPLQDEASKSFGPWYNQAVFYHIYPLGLCGCAHENTGVKESHFEKLNEWAEHAKNIGCTAIYIGPLFESVGHGYETTDYKKVDQRIGTNDEFKEFVKKCHEMGVKVVVDGVFNHTGREFFAFQDIKANREQSRYKDWYCNVNFGGNNEYNDGFSYENWGGYNLLAKLNVWNPEVKNYLFEVVTFWIKEFDIDGIRLDAADVLDMGFMSELKHVTDGLKQDFWLMGEVIHGDYGRWANSERLNSVTNYELHKGLYSGHNDHNYFEIAHTINRLNNLTQGIKLYTFADNHDVARIATKLNNKEHIYDVMMLVCTVPGIPSIYYGSEFAVEGNKENGSDWNLRPCLELDDYDEDAELITLIRRLGYLKKQYKELTNGEYKQLLLTNRQFAFARISEDGAVITALNNDDEPARLEIPLVNSGDRIENLLENETMIEKAGDRIIINLPANRGTIIYTGK
jgi:MAF protein